MSSSRSNAEVFDPSRRTAPEAVELALGDGYRTYMLVHRPVGAVSGLPVLYLHGIQSHPGWFLGSAAALAAGGHPVYQVTRRGSGENQQARGDALSAKQLLDDVETACRFVLRDAGAPALDLVGVSWGGKLLASYVATHSAWHGHPGHVSHGRLGRGQSEGEAGTAPKRMPERAMPQVKDFIASLTLIAPGVVALRDVSVGAKLAIAASLLFSPRRPFAIPLNEVELFTDNEKLREFLRRDPLRLHEATARMLYASRRLDRLLRRAPGGSLDVPTTLLLSTRDRIIDSAATRREVERLTAGRVVVREMPGAHTLEFEEDPSPLYGELLAAVRRGEPA